MDKPTLLNWTLPERVDFTTDDRFLAAKFPGRTIMNPSTNYFETEAKFYGLNWVLLWCMAYVASNSFFVNERTLSKNFFGLLSPEKKNQAFKSQDEGIRAGIQNVAALMGLKHVKPIVWEGTKKLIEAKQTPITKLEEFDQYYGAGFAADVLKVYEEICAYAKGEDIDPDPVIISPVDAPTPKPLPPEIPEDPKAPKAPSTFWSKVKNIIFLVAGVGGGVLFFLGIFFPAAVPFLAPVITVIQTIAQYLKDSGQNLLPQLVPQPSPQPTVSQGSVLYLVVVYLAYFALCELVPRGLSKLRSRRDRV